MPITLPPISRRRFLFTSAALTAGFALGRRRALAADADPDRIALLSDTHVAADKATLGRGINMAEHLTRAASDVIGVGPRPSMAFVTGDLAFNSGESGDYATFLGLVDPIRAAGIPVHLGLGNHDNRERFWGAVPEDGKAPRPVEKRQVMVVESPKATWVLLDSLDKTLTTPGVLGPEQLAWLGGELDRRKEKNGNKPVVVMVHHNPIDVKPPAPKAAPKTGSEPGKKGKATPTPGLIDRDDFLAMLSPRTQVKAVVFGHTHEWYHQKRPDGLHLVNRPPVAYVFTPGRPAGWVDTKMSDGGALMQLRCVDPNHPQHMEKLELAWRA